jgi:radical SAM family uncharacterized protein
MARITDEMLMSVEKPARYTGGEVNMVKKNPSEVKVRYAICFPDVYEVAMSHLGIRILYHLLNERIDTYCERVYAPWVDMEEVMRKNNVPLYALETGDSLSDFDLAGFTLQYEMSYTNIINMLDMANIPLYAKDRKSGPFIHFGGPCAYNPEPLADIADFFLMGEGEELNNEVVDEYIKWKESGEEREAFLKRICRIKGVYVPSFYDVEYNDDGTIKRRVKLYDQAPDIIEKRIVEDLNTSYYPEKLLVPLTEIIHDRAVLETFRGCTRGCRFCQAGMIYRPVREKSTDTLLQQADKILAATGYDEISLTSLSICDYSDIHNLVRRMMEENESRKVGVSLPSLRIDSFSVDLINEIQKVRKTGLTFAPEAGTQKMRDVINKGVTEGDLINSVTSAFQSGWSTIKLYFMIGLPFETMEDVAGIADLAQEVVEAYMGVSKQQRKKGLSITVSTSSFVPKPFTPFQWVPQDKRDILREKQSMLKERIKSRFVKYAWHESPVSFMEAVFARGDRRLGRVLVEAWKNGCRFDGWADQFNWDGWVKAFGECKVDPDFYAYRQRELDENLPWDFVDVGVSKAYLISEYKKSGQAALTHDCRLGCTGCGIKKYLKGGECFNGAHFN